MQIQLKRAYDEASADDGFRILVDRFWPRGVSKEKAKIDLWLKEIAPSDELRKWVHNNLDQWPEFRKRYFKELKNNDEAVDTLKEKAHDGPVTLVYAYKNPHRNHAIELKAFLERK